MASPDHIRRKIDLLYEYQAVILGLESRLHNVRCQYELLQGELMAYRIDLPLMKSELVPRTSHAVSFRAHALGIGALPNEILLYVFEIFLSNSHHQRIRRLLLVCKRWNSLIMHCSKLWARIKLCPRFSWNFQVATSITYIKACLERSQPLSLDIDLDYSNFRSREGHIREELEMTVRMIADEDESDDIFDWALNVDCDFASSTYDQYFQETLDDLDALIGLGGIHIGRWKSLKLCFPWQELFVAQDLWVKFIGRTPYLTEAKIIQLDTIFDISDDDELFMSFPDLSNLRSLTLEDGQVRHLLKDPTSGPLSTLRHLDISYGSLDNILDLSAFTHLRKLCLRGGAGFHSVDQTTEEPILTIRLVDLEELHLKGYSPNLKKFRFEFPSLRDLLVESVKAFYVPPGLSPIHIRWTIRDYVDPPWAEEAIKEAFTGVLELSKRTEVITVQESVRPAISDVLTDLRRANSLPESLNHIVVELENGETDVIKVMWCDWHSPLPCIHNICNWLA